MDHKDRDCGILGLVQHAGVEIVNLAVLDGGVRHFGGKEALIEDFECKIESRECFVYDTVSTQCYQYGL